MPRPKHQDAPTATSGDDAFSPLPIIAQVTAGTGALLLIAAAVQSTGVGRMINVGAGTTVLMIAAGCYWLDRTITRKPVRGCRAALRTSMRWLSFHADRRWIPGAVAADGSIVDLREAARTQR